MARYRRKRPTGKDHLMASAMSLLVGAGAALASYYLARLFLARDELPQRGRESDSRALRAGAETTVAGELGRPDGRAEPSGS